MLRVREVRRGVRSVEVALRGVEVRLRGVPIAMPRRRRALLGAAM